MKKSELQKFIKSEYNTILEFGAIDEGEGKYWVSHTGAEVHEKYLTGCGQLGTFNKASIFDSLDKAEIASKKTGLNTHVIDHCGRIVGKSGAWFHNLMESELKTKAK
jgi:hypothetical protein